MEKGWNYRVFFACRCWCFLFFSLFPARSLLFSFSGLLLVCVILSPLPPSQRRLFALRYQRISELRHEAPRNFNTSLAAWESPFPLSWASILPYLHSLPGVYYGIQREICGSYICSATRSLATVYGLLVNCRRQMLMSPYWRTLGYLHVFAASHIAEHSDRPRICTVKLSSVASYAL